MESGRSRSENGEPDRLDARLPIRWPQGEAEKKPCSEKRAMVSATQRWKARMISRRSSRSRREASAVEPTRSTNMTVSCRRSASGSAALESEWFVDRPSSAMALRSRLRCPSKYRAAGGLLRSGRTELLHRPHSRGTPVRIARGRGVATKRQCPRQPPSPEFALRHTNEEVPTRHHHSVTTVMLLKR